MAVFLIKKNIIKIWDSEEAGSPQGTKKRRLLLTQTALFDEALFY